MRLSELSPCWFAHGGNDRAGFVFLCPHCRKTWLSCTLVGMKISEQCDVFIEAIMDAGGECVPCKQNNPWTLAGGTTFEDLSITPSLDASASGHWHGFITKGEIVGGVIAA